MTVYEMLERISSAELAEWMAYYAFEPFGPRQEDYRAGIIAAPICNAYKASGVRSMRPTDFFDYETVQQSSDVLLAMARLAFPGKGMNDG